MEESKLSLGLKGSRELNLLEEAFNSMIDNLHQSRLYLDKTLDKLALSNKLLELLLEGTKTITRDSNKLDALNNTANIIFRGIPELKSKVVDLYVRGIGDDDKMGDFFFRVTTEVSESRICQISRENQSSEYFSVSLPSIVERISKSGF